MNNRFIIGCGTGRCGTSSLKRLLNAQPGTSVSHEMRPTLPWVITDKAVTSIWLRVERIRQRVAGLTGDVASYYLPYLEMMLYSYPEMLVIWMVRDPEEVADSFMRKTGQRDHWHNTGGHPLDPQWDRCFPSYPLSVSKRKAILLYCKEYADKMSCLYSRYPDRIRKTNIDELNEPEAINLILDYVGIQKRGRVIKAFHVNKCKGK